MKPNLFALAATTIFALLTPARADIERTVEKTFSVEPGGTLDLTGFGGEIRVETGSDREVRIVARQHVRNVRSDEQVEDALRDVTLEFSHEGNRIGAVARRNTRMSWRSPQVSIGFTAIVPRHFDLNLKTSGGAIRVADLTGDVHVRTSGGRIELGHIHGDVDAGTSGGPISVSESNGRVTLRTSGGGIRIGHIKGPATVSTSGGSIRIDSASDTVEASTSGGSIQISFAPGITADCNLRTSGGSIVARVPAASSFQLDARTSGGSVSAAGFSIRTEDGEMGKSRLTGAINGGGSQLTLRTSGGSIRVEPHSEPVASR